MLRHGPEVVEGGVVFRVWAPNLDRLAVRVAGTGHPMRKGEDGAFEALVPGAGHGTRYELVLPDGALRPDPASRRQPDGVHGPSQVFDPGIHAWRNFAPGLPLEAMVFYELHVGTFTAEGTLDAAAERLSELADLGVTCVELMPLQPFPGTRNWGYDGVQPWAVHEAYGGPAALQRFVDRAHAFGLTVCVDVVYNHLGPEGNYTAAFGPYLTSRHRSPWGDGLDFDGAGAGPIRAFMIGAALQWVRDFRVDALRLDATHAITDDSWEHLVTELVREVAAEAARSGRRVHVIAEDERNDRKVVEPPPAGWGCAAVWADDFHHAIHALVTGERARFLVDFGRPDDLTLALSAGFVYQGEVSAYHRKPRGTPSAGLAPSRFVVCGQNHDQAGNRPLGERLSTLVPWDALAPISSLVLLGSGLPLLFMGEEYGEQNPFLYFTSHTDPALAKAVSEGRRREFIGEVGDRVPDPQEEETFRRSRLTHRRDGRYGALRDHYKRMLGLRKRYASEIAAGWPAVERRDTVFTLRRPGLTVEVNLGRRECAGLPGFGLRVRTGGAG